MFDKETIYGIVASGKYSRTEAATLQGAKLSKEQREWWTEATILKKAEDERKRERTKRVDGLVFGGPMDSAEKMRKSMLLKAAIDDVLDDALARIDKARRARAESSLLEFVKTYGCDEGAFLEEPPSPRMERILEEMQTAVDDSSIPYHIRVARGHGKTSYAKLACAWAAATGRRKFIVVVGSNAGNALNIVNDIYSFFAESPLFGQDFPEVSVPMAAINGVYQRAKAQTYRGKPTKLKLGMGNVVLPSIEGAKSSGCIIQSVGFATSARGKVKGKQRPDLVILDDLQSDDMAGNEERVLAAAEHLKKTFLGLAGHRRKIAAIMTSTPIEPDDLSETFARDPAWKTTTHKMVIEWPTCWKCENEADDLWARYRDILRRETLAGNRAPHVVANKFYAEHRAEMDAGAVVLNPSNYDAKTELSGIQHAMNILIRDGEEVFASEYQMMPRRHSFAFEISAELIMSRARRGTGALYVPDSSELVVVATDINPSYALTTAAVSFCPDRTAFVLAYHVTKISIDDSANDTEYHRLVYDALAAHGRELRSALHGVRIDRWAIDAGGKQIQPVTAFVSGGMAEETSGCDSAVALVGRSWRSWNDRPKNAVRQASNFTVQIKGERGRRFTLWNADYYKETAQKCWATETGGPGGCSMFDGGVDHSEFAIQVANEKLKMKRKLVDGYDYKWKTMEPHDYGDCMAMCYAVAGANGINGDVVVGAREKDDDEVLFL